MNDKQKLTHELSRRIEAKRRIAKRLPENVKTVSYPRTLKRSREAVKPLPVTVSGHTGSHYYKL